MAVLDTHSDGTVDICLCLNVSPVKSFNPVLRLLCVYFFVCVAAGLFLLNRRHRQAMGLHRRHTHQGTAPPSWPVRYLSVQPAALGPFWVFFSARSRCFLSDLHRRTACLRHVRVRAPLGRHFPHHSPCRGQKIR